MTAYSNLSQIVTIAGLVKCAKSTRQCIAPDSTFAKYITGCNYIFFSTRYCLHCLCFADFYDLLIAWEWFRRAATFGYWLRHLLPAKCIQHGSQQTFFVLVLHPFCWTWCDKKRKCHQTWRRMDRMNSFQVRLKKLYSALQGCNLRSVFSKLPSLFF